MAPTPLRPSDRVRSRPRAAELLHSPPPCATGQALSVALPHSMVAALSAEPLPPRLPRLSGVPLQLGAGLRSLPASGVVPAIALDDAPPCPSVLWRPVERRWMPSESLHQLAHSEACCANAPFATKKIVPLEF